MDSLQFRFRIFFIVFAAVFALALLGFMALEGLSLANAFYFSIGTMATVGYGDLAHLKGDIQRVYSLLVRQWVHSMRYLKSQYPYLFSLALRTNPFDREASPIVRN
jgi:hypothetical protein